MSKEESLANGLQYIKEKEWGSALECLIDANDRETLLQLAEMMEEDDRERMMKGDHSCTWDLQAECYSHIQDYEGLFAVVNHMCANNAYAPAARYLVKLREVKNIIGNNLTAKVESFVDGALKQLSEYYS